MKAACRAFGQIPVAPASHLYRLPHHITFEQAALIDTLPVCLHAQHLSGPRDQRRRRSSAPARSAWGNRCGPGRAPPFPYSHQRNFPDLLQPLWG